MLILTRNVGESVMIGSRISITVCRIKGDQVQIEIAAPNSTVVHPEETYQRTKGISSKVRLEPPQSHRRALMPR